MMQSYGDTAQKTLLAYACRSKMIMLLCSFFRTVIVIITAIVMNHHSQHQQGVKTPIINFNYHSPAHVNSLLSSASLAQFQSNLQQHIPRQATFRPLQSLFQMKDCQVEEELDTTFDESQPEVQQPQFNKKAVAQSTFLPVFQKSSSQFFNFARNSPKCQPLTFNPKPLKRSCMPGSFQSSFPSKTNSRGGKQNHQFIKNSLLQSSNSLKGLTFSKNVNINKPRRFFKHLSTAKISEFQIGEMLGKGSVGKVYHARHISTNTRYALKKVVKSEVTDIDQFCLGVKCQIFFKDPHLAQIYAVFHDAAHIYLLLELCVDGSLNCHRKAMRTDYQRNKVIHGLAQGVEVMHQHNVRHGDLKLENILISFGFPKITDFDCVFRGSSQSFRELRKKNQLWGSPAYFSPAMVQHSTFSLSDDIWSIGVIMYEVYCKCHPFQLSACQDLTKIVHREILPFPSELRQTVKTILTHLLCKQPERRTSLAKLIKCCEYFNEQYLHKH